nr:unnamed protein product [Digitaria exilis]
MSPSLPSGVSVSTVADTVSATETHLFKIEGYNRLRDMHGTVRCLESSRFQAGGHAWRIRCYPNGDAAANAACVSLYLLIDDGLQVPAKDVRAEVTLSLLRHPGAPVASLLPPRRRSFTFTYNKIGAMAPCARALTRTTAWSCGATSRNREDAGEGGGRAAA